MDDIGNFQNIAVKQADGIRVRQHQTCGGIVNSGAQCVKVYAAIRIGGHVNRSKPAMAALAGLVP